ncbi:MAG: hypothetical protein OJF59_001784 [Cytophagales bacterium]|jgi:hypothetical protein|nr:MAG: hypothetical protein OJF59_001784 [Cytophagales bacterium]
MMGSKLKLDFITENQTGLGMRYRWKGKMMGFKNGLYSREGLGNNR